MTLTLFHGADLLPTFPPRQAHSETSREAAEAFAPHLGRGQMAVLRWLAAQDGARSDNQIITAMVAEGWSPNGPRARRVELVESGMVEAAGRVGKSTGWVVTEAGRAFLRGDAE